MAKRKGTGRREGRQQTIPGVLPKVDKQLLALAEKYRAARDERMELTQAEVEAKARLIGGMQAKHVEVFRFEDGEGRVFVVSLKTDHNVKVKAESGGDEIEPGSGADHGEPDEDAAPAKAGEPT